VNKESTSNTQPAGIFLNGRAQIIEMLRIMEPAERDHLIKNLRRKNPAVANELLEQSITFDQISFLSDPEIKMIYFHVPAAVMGVALKNIKEELQRRLLTLAPRAYAEEAYSVMVTQLDNERRDIPKAQNKIINVMINLHRGKKIHL
jgi:flagellar motor switch protein FliG